MKGNTEINSHEIIESPTPENPLKEVANYYLSRQGVPSKSQELKQQALLLLVSLSGATLYIFPAKALADNHGQGYAGASELAKEINYILGTTACALVVLYNSTDIFFNIRRSEKIPAELLPYLNAAASRLKDAAIVTGAAISSIPLALVSIAYPLPIQSRIVQAAMVAVIEVDNTVLHVLPFNLAMRHEIYRLPVLPLELLVKKFYQSRHESPLAITDQEAEVIRAATIQYLQYVQNKILLDAVFITPKLTYHWQFQAEFEALMRHSGTDYLAALTQQFPPLQGATIKNPSRCYQVLGETIGVSCAFFIWSSCSGYLMEPINQLMDWTGNPVLTGVAVAPALYFLSVLLSFFGYSIGKNSYHYFTHWGENDAKLPLAFKLYPKTFAFIMVINVYLSLYSYAAAEELIHDNFQAKHWDVIRPVLLWAARTGLPFLSLNAIKDCSAALLRKWAIHFGDDMTQLVASLTTATEQMVMAMTAAKPETLSHSKEYLESISILKQPRSPLSETTEPTPTVISKKQGWLNWVPGQFCFWQTSETTATKAELKTEKDSTNEQTPLLQTLS